MNVQKPTVKPFDIPKRLVFDAYQRVKANHGAAGVDGQSIAEFEVDLKNNLYKLWNRLSSGTWFPPPVRAVEIPKRGTGRRMLGIPTVADRIAQTAVAMVLEPVVEPLFHDDSFGYRPRRSALDAVGRCRQRCWEHNWVLDLDIRSFFDSVPHDLLLEMVSRYADQRWMLICIERWLTAPLLRSDGTQENRDRGTPQGSAISPVLANIFMHHVFDMWMTEHFPNISFERYCDDVVVHCSSERQANHVKAAIVERLATHGLEVHPDKTKIAYCKDDNRKADHDNVKFDFCGYTFRPRKAENRNGVRFTAFLPAVGDSAAKKIRTDMRAWRIGRSSEKSVSDLASMINIIVRGWINYYGRYYPSRLVQVLRHINPMLVKWALRKFKRLRRSQKRAWLWLANVARREPNLFAHWRFGARPGGWATGAG